MNFARATAPQLLETGPPQATCGRPERSGKTVIEHEQASLGGAQA